MQTKIVDSSEVKMSPAKAILRFENILMRDGRKRALKSVSFQKERELWVAGVFLLGYSQLTKQKYWIQENPQKHEDPDVFAYSYRDPREKGEIGVVKEIIPLEICEYPIYSQFGLVDHIKTKLKNKYYHNETWVVCYIQRPGESMKLINVINKLQGLKTTVREIWLLFHIDGNNPTNFNIARVYSRGFMLKEIPIFKKGDYKELMKIPQAEFMKDQLGMDKTVTIKSSRKIIVPLPKDHI